MMFELMSCLMIILLSQTLSTSGGISDFAASALKTPNSVMNLVTSTLLDDHCAVFVMVNREEGYHDQLKDHTPWGLAVFEVQTKSNASNQTQMQLMSVVKQVSRLRQTLQCATVLVVSDDPAFLTMLAEYSLQSRLLVWTTRLILLTRLKISQVRGLHKLFSTSNSMALIMQDNTPKIRVSLYAYLPYTPVDHQPLQVGVWSEEQGLTLTSHLPLFPDKYTVFLWAPTLVVAVEPFPGEKLFWVEDPTAPGGRRLEYTGSTANCVQYTALGMNFTTRYVKPSDGSFGGKLPNGSFDGMVGMVMREEVDWAPGPFILSPTRAEAVEYSWSLDSGMMKILAAVGGPEVDEWSFLLPLAPNVWLGILASAFVISSILQASIVSMSGNFNWLGTWTSCMIKSLRILFQQDLTLGDKWMWSERVVVGLWMLTTLILTRSYAGNLMSLLAVRHIPQPYQSLQDVLDDSSVTMIWQENSNNKKYLKSVESGLFREVAERETENKLIYRYYDEFAEAINTLVRRGDHVLIDNNIDLTNAVIQVYSMTGICKFYISREGYLPFNAGPITQIGNPLLRGLNKRLMMLSDTGIYHYWSVESLPNATNCLNMPKRILVQSSLSLAVMWGMLAVLGGGWLAGGIVLAAEISMNKLQ